MKTKILFAAVLAALSAALAALSLLLPADNPLRNSESRPGPLLAAALSGPARQGDDLEMNSLLEACKKSGLVSRATVINSGKRIVADTEADAIGSLYPEAGGTGAPETFDIPGGKLLLHNPMRKDAVFSIARLCGLSGLAASLLAAFILTGLSHRKTPQPSPAEAFDRELILAMLKKGGVSRRFIVLDSAGTITGSGPGNEEEFIGKKLFDCNMRNEILNGAENPDNVFDAGGSKFIFY